MKLSFEFNIDKMSPSTRSDCEGFLFVSTILLAIAVVVLFIVGIIDPNLRYLFFCICYVLIAIIIKAVKLGQRLSRTTERVHISTLANLAETIVCLFWIIDAIVIVCVVIFGYMKRLWDDIKTLQR